MQINKEVNNLVEVGFGYGRFTIHAAKRISVRLVAFDIDQEMIDFTRKKAEKRCYQ